MESEQDELINQNKKLIMNLKSRRQAQKPQIILNALTIENHQSVFMIVQIKMK